MHQPDHAGSSVPVCVALFGQSGPRASCHRSSEVPLPNASLLLLLVVVAAWSVLRLLGIVDVWSKQRFPTVQERVLWTVALVIAGLPALIAYVFVVKRRLRAPAVAA